MELKMRNYSELEKSILISIIKLQFLTQIF